MNSKIDNILTECIQEGWYDSHVIDCNASEVEKAMLEFGKQCFEAGRESKRLYNPEKDGKLEMITLIIEFKTFEDYLKSLENE